MAAKLLGTRYAGALYHVMSRGNRGEAVYREDGDRELWLDTLGEACEKTGWRIHVYVMLDNHYHMLIESPEAEKYLENGLRIVCKWGIPGTPPLSLEKQGRIVPVPFSSTVEIWIIS